MTAENEMMEPWGARQLSEEELEHLLRVKPLVHDYAARVAGSVDEVCAEQNREDASNWRELRSTLQPGDTPWLLSEPPEHREFIEGTMSLVVVRKGAVVARHLIYSG